jgi:integrase
MLKGRDLAKNKQQPQAKESHEKNFQKLTSATPNLIYLRDGEVVLYKRSSTPIYQCRYKLEGKGWVRVSTHKASLENAVAVACDLYDEARYRHKLGLAHATQNFAHIAQATLKELRQQIDLGKGKTAFHSYVSCIEKYFIPYFGEKYLEQLSHNDITEFELWRNRQMGKLPKASTLNNFSSAWNRLLATAVNKGWISERAPIPKLNGGGLKSQARPAFSREEIDYLLVYMAAWAERGRLDVEREMRPLLRDYVEMLLLTGMRHGTEAMGLEWHNIEWHTHEDKKYLRLRVSGKTGGRWLIAKHRAVDVLRRLHNRQSDIKDISFDELLKSRVPHKLFRFSNGYQPPSLNGTFRRLMRDSGLEKNSEAQTRTLYSLRHTYATFELLENRIDIHTLAKQMGNSAAMIERHYSKLTATMAAERLA